MPTWKELIFALSLAMLAYTGIETVANMAEEASDPGTQVPKAVNLVVLAVLGVYAGISVVALSALPVDPPRRRLQRRAQTEPSATPGYATALGGFFENDPVLGVIEHLGLHGTVLKLAKYYVGLLAATILFIATNAGHDRHLAPVVVAGRAPPAAELFSQLHPTYRTPWFTLMFFSLLAGALIIYGNTEVLGNLYSFGAMLSFTTAHAAIVALRVKDPDRERPYRMPWNVRIRGAMIPMTAVIGGIGTFAAWVAVTCCTPRRSIVGIPWMIVGMAGYFIYRRRQGLDPRKHYRIERARAPAPTSRSSSTGPRSCRSSATTSARPRCSSAAKLIGDEGVVYAIFVLPVPSQLSLEAGSRRRRRRGARCSRAPASRPGALGIKIHTGLIRTRNPGAALVEEAERVGCDVIYWSTIHAPAGEQGIGPTAAYLLSKRPCRVIIETDRATPSRDRRRREPAASVGRAPSAAPAPARAGGTRSRAPAPWRARRARRW